MGLIKKTSDAKIPGAPAKGTTLGAKTEPDPTEKTVAAAAPAAAEAAAPAAAPAPAASASQPSTAVVVPPKAQAMTVASIKAMDVIGQAEKAYPVDWNTLDRVQANNGKFLDLGKNKADMGDTIQMQLLSWQQTWQISPGSNDPSSKEFVRYSEDGVVTKQGENIAEYLEKLREQFPKAKMDERCTLVGVLVGSEKDSRLEGELFQIDLSSTSRAEFDKYRLATAYKIGKGLLDPAAAQLMTMTAEVASFKENSWTLVRFTPTVSEEVK